MVKQCSRCGESKPLEEFVAEPRNRDGRQNMCVPCARTYRKALRTASSTYAAMQRERDLRFRRAHGRRSSAAATRRYRRSHPEYRRAERARRRGAPMDAETRAFVPVLMQDPCAYCGEPAATLDHIDPLVRGGSSSLENLTAACSPCNASKNASPLLTWLAERN